MGTSRSTSSRLPTAGRRRSLTSRPCPALRTSSLGRSASSRPSQLGPSPPHWERRLVGRRTLIGRPGPPAVRCLLRVGVTRPCTTTSTGVDGGGGGGGAADSVFL